MKITKRQIRRIVQESIASALQEARRPTYIDDKDGNFRFFVDDDGGDPNWSLDCEFHPDRRDNEDSHGKLFCYHAGGGGSSVYKTAARNLEDAIEKAMEFQTSPEWQEG